MSVLLSRGVCTPPCHQDVTPVLLGCGVSVVRMQCWCQCYIADGKSAREFGRIMGMYCTFQGGQETLWLNSGDRVQGETACSP